MQAERSEEIRNTGRSTGKTTNKDDRTHQNDLQCCINALHQQHTSSWRDHAATTEIQATPHANENNHYDPRPRMETHDPTFMNPTPRQSQCPASHITLTTPHTPIMPTQSNPPHPNTPPGCLPQSPPPRPAITPIATHIQRRLPPPHIPQHPPSHHPAAHLVLDLRHHPLLPPVHALLQLHVSVAERRRTALLLLALGAQLGMALAVEAQARAGEFSPGHVCVLVEVHLSRNEGLEERWDEVMVHGRGW